jgi:hypothetical protein
MGLWPLAPHSRIFHLYLSGVISDNLDVIYNRIGGVMVNVLTSSAIDRGFESRSCQTKENQISKSYDWLDRNQDNVST